jgi:hypothetical protein
VQPPISDLVDGRGIRVARVMPDTKREVAECEAIGITDEAKDHAELAVGRRQIDLEASGQLRPVTAFGIAAAQDFDLDTVLLKLAPRSLGQ